jgi:predicted acylesterase/phospholipase RssA
MGAIIASLYVLGKTSNDMEAIVQNIKWLSLVDFDMRKGLIKGIKIEKFLDRLFE